MWDKYLHNKKIVYENSDLSLVFSDDNIYINYEDFKAKKIQALYITGLSGSGKSTLGRKLAKELECEFIELDEFSWRNHTKYIKEYFDNNSGKYAEYLDCWSKDGNARHIEKWDTFRNIVVDGTIWILEHHRNKQFILEGVHLPFMYETELERGEFELFKEKNYAMILVSTSTLKSIFRRFYRDGYVNLSHIFSLYKRHTNAQNVFRRDILKHSGIEWVK